MAIVIGPISLEHQSLGRLLAQQINTDVIAMLRKAGDVDGTEFFRHFLASSARKISSDAGAGMEAFKVGTPLTSEEIAALSPEEIEELAGQYIASRAAWQIRKDEGPEGNADRVLAAAKRILEEHDAASDKFRKKIEAMGVSDDLKALMEKTSQASRSLSDILGPTRSLSDILGPTHSLQEAIRKATFAPPISDALKAALEPSQALKAAMDAMKNPAMTAAMDAVRRAEEMVPSYLRDLLDTSKSIDLGDMGFSAGLPGGDGSFPREPKDALPRMPRIEIPRNPVFDTNAILRQVSDDIERMVELSDRQSQLIQLLSETANLALGEAASSSAEAKRSAELAKEATTFTKWSVVVAVIAIVLSGAVSGFAILDARRIAEGNDVMANELIEAVREGTRVSQGMQQDIRDQSKASEAQTKALLESQAALSRSAEAAIGRHAPSKQSAVAGP